MSDLKLQNLMVFHFIAPYFLIIQKYFTCSSGRFVFFLSVSIWYFQTIFKSFFHFSLCFDLQLQFILWKKDFLFWFVILIINLHKRYNFLQFYPTIYLFLQISVCYFILPFMRRSLTWMPCWSFLKFKIDENLNLWKIILDQKLIA